MKMRIEGTDGAAILAVLYNHCRPQGNRQLTVQDAAVILEQGYTHFDSLRGQILKVDLSGSETVWKGGSNGQ